MAIIMSSMKSRLLTAAIGIPVAVGIIVLGELFHWVNYVILALICPIIIYEYLAARKLHKNLMVLIPCMLYALVQPLLVPMRFGLAAAYIFAVLMFFIMILFHESIDFNDASFAIFGTLIIVFGISSILIIPSQLRGYYSLFFLMCLGIPWFSDGGAYFAGVFLGKHKLCPKISPKKTVEGFIGGIVAGILSALVIVLIFNAVSPTLKLNLLTSLILGAAVSAISVVGDLSFSLVKRTCGIKDFGSFFPGHGGFLDRFDSVIISAPAVYLTATLFPLFSV